MQNSAYQQKFVQTVENSLANDRLEVLDRKVTRPERHINAFVNDIRTDCGTSRVLRDDDIVDAVGAIVKSENCRKKLAHIHTHALRPSGSLLFVLASVLFMCWKHYLTF